MTVVKYSAIYSSVILVGGTITSSVVCGIINSFVASRSRKFSSIEEMNGILEKEKKRLGIEDYDISLVYNPNVKASKCNKQAQNQYVLVFNDSGLNLGIFRHELRHVTDSGEYNPLTYIFFKEPRAVAYSLTALEKISQI